MVAGRFILFVVVGVAAAPGVPLELVSAPLVFVLCEAGVLVALVTALAATGFSCCGGTGVRCCGGLATRLGAGSGLSTDFSLASSLLAALELAAVSGL